MNTKFYGGGYPNQAALFVWQRGFTLLELLISLVIVSILLLALSGLIGRGLRTYEAISGESELNRQARVAMDHMVRAVSRSPQLLLPLNDNPATNWPENIREETLPPTPPVGDSIRASAVLAVTLDRSLDLDRDGIPDADQDGDGRIDEDFGTDSTNDMAPGIYLIDDDGDGQVDEGSDSGDDDEDGGIAGEDPVNGLDDDGDINIDEDPGGDINLDGCPGMCGVDDNSDGLIDNVSAADDDEDGDSDEDWIDPLVFYLDNDTLMQRTPVPWDASGSGDLTGRDFIIEVLAEKVTRFRVERLAQAGERTPLVVLVLELTDPDRGDTVSLETRVRVGGDL